MAIYDVTCRIVEGQPSGGVSSGKVIIEWDKTHATLIAGGGVMRSSGSIRRDSADCLARADALGANRPS